MQIKAHLFRSNAKPQNLSPLLLLILGTTLFLGGCPADQSDPDPADAGIHPQDAALDGEDDGDVEPEDREDESCILELQTSDGLVLARTKEEPIEAEITPLICWTVPDDAALPEEAGWTLRVEREEFAGTEIIANLHWYINEGIPAELRELRYGDCPEAVDECTEAWPLTEGTYFLHLFDARRPDGLAASLVFEVRSED